MTLLQLLLGRLLMLHQGQYEEPLELEIFFEPVLKKQKNNFLANVMAASFFEIVRLLFHIEYD